MLATSMPLKDDSAVKEYLLSPQCRSELLAASGAVAQCINGADALQPLLTGRCFVCLHYKLGPGAMLHPCLPDSFTGTGTQETEKSTWCVSSSVSLPCLRYKLGAVAVLHSCLPEGRIPDVEISAWCVSSFIVLTVTAQGLGQAQHFTPAHLTHLRCVSCFMVFTLLAL